MIDASALAAWLPLMLAAAGEELASVWRIELLHPAVAHFPIVLMPLGTVFWLLGGVKPRWPRLEAFELVGGVVLALAMISAWAATQTGFWADEVVGRDLYDPRPLKDHENLAVLFAWLTSGCVFAVALHRFLRMPPAAKQYLRLAVAIGLLVSCGLIAYVSHLGAGLVYEQGAGVIMPE